MITPKLGYLGQPLLLFICLAVMSLVPFVLLPVQTIAVLANAGAHARHKRWKNVCLSILIAVYGIVIEAGVFILFPFFPGMAV